VLSSGDAADTKVPDPDNGDRAPFGVWSTGSGRICMRHRIDMVAKWAEKGSTQSGGEAFSLGFVLWR
jgi:hypothetical protein